MAIRILWSLEEAIIMLDFLLKNINGEINRKEAISAVSKELRERAIRNGIEIDYVFRNINGITLQMSCMEYILTDGKCGLAKSVKVFHEAVELYRNNNPAYLRLLKEARKMPKSKSVQDRFFEWMEKQVSPIGLADMFLVVQDIESFCIDRKILKKKLFETTDLSTIRQVHNTVTSNKIFRRIYKNKLSKMESLILQYHRFLRAETKKEKQTVILMSEVTQVTSKREADRVLETYSKTEKTAEVQESKKPLNQQIEREKFSLWMQNSGMSNSTARCYVSALNSFSVYLSNKAGKRISIYEEDDERLLELRNSLASDTEMKTLNIQFHSQISAGLNKLISCRSGEVIVATSSKRKVKDEAITAESIPKIEIPDFSKLGNRDVDLEMEQFDKILRNNFTEGLLPNALRLDKFRMFFEEEFGYEPTSDDDRLILQLKKAGTYIDDRIYPKQDAKQSNLTADILTEIINTLNSGARCIYFTCVFEKWRTELANELNVYNEETLKALLSAQNIDGLILTDYVLKATRQKVYPEENVVEVMRESHSFMSYEQLMRKLWFIPIDVIKHTLVTTPSIVNVDAETYFYAPNFPASTEELQHIKQLMANKLDEKGYLVAPDIYELIHCNCHTVEINTVGYKDWAYRNVFKYLFREEFEFGSSVISKKGNALEMWQVYREYCREHERISLDDLKQLKDELGVAIYWDTVMDEMVRISSEELIRKDQVHFDIDAIDAVLEEMCSGDYVPLKDITLFLHFPTIEYHWNSFVLESYLPMSKKFCLYHASYASHGVFGVMVRRDSKLSDYKAVVVDMLSRSDEWQTTKQALELIVKKGYQARKKWAGFEKITQEASLLREKLLEEGK